MKQLFNQRKAVAITGTRDIDTKDIKAIRAKVARLLIDPEVVTIYFGGAKGADTEALKAALALRTVPSAPKLVCVLPCKLQDQPQETQSVSKQADEIIELGVPISSNDKFEAYHVRNRYMVDRSNLVVAFWNGRLRSGTYSTLSYARSKGITVEVVTVGAIHG